MEYINIFKETLLTKYADFSGNATRTEFWTFFVIEWLLCAILGVISSALSSIVSLALLIPMLAVGARRLRDRGVSPWLWLIALTGIGYLVLIYFWATKK